MKNVELKISLPSIDSVKRFVATSMQFDGEVDLTSDRYVIDGKSIMGVFSLDLSKPINCSIKGKDDEVDTFVKNINPFTE